MIVTALVAMSATGCKEDVSPVAVPHAASRSIAFAAKASRGDEAIFAEIQSEVPTAYNGGRSSASNTVYFVGDADGPNPNQINCQ
jgi:hypothetical protein